MLIPLLILLWASSLVSSLSITICYLALKLRQLAAWLILSLPYFAKLIQPRALHIVFELISYHLVC